MVYRIYTCLFREKEEEEEEVNIITIKVSKTRSTQRAQTSAERQHNKIAEWFLQCKLAMRL